MRTITVNSLSSAVTTSSFGIFPEFICSIPLTLNSSCPVRPRLAADSPGLNCSGSTPMPMRLDRWMRSNDSASTARTPSSAVPFAAQSREEHEQRDAVGEVPAGGVVDGHLLTGRHVHGDAALGARRELVAQPDVGERAA